MADDALRRAQRAVVSDPSDLEAVRRLEAELLRARDGVAHSCCFHPYVCAGESPPDRLYVGFCCRSGCREILLAEWDAAWPIEAKTHGGWFVQNPPKCRVRLRRRRTVTLTGVFRATETLSALAAYHANREAFFVDALTRQYPRGSWELRDDRYEQRENGGEVYAERVYAEILYPQPPVPPCGAGLPVADGLFGTVRFGPRRCGRPALHEGQHNDERYGAQWSDLPPGASVADAGAAAAAAEETPEQLAAAFLRRMAPPVSAPPSDWTLRPCPLCGRVQSCDHTREERGD